jgi:hypothetical protein
MFNRIMQSALLFFLILFLIILLKPKAIFKEDGSLKEFGLDKNQTIFHFGVVTIVAAIVSFWVIAVVDYTSDDDGDVDMGMTNKIEGQPYQNPNMFGQSS